jgi:hypothetical protein
VARGGGCGAADGAAELRADCFTALGKYITLGLPSRLEVAPADARGLGAAVLAGLAGGGAADVAAVAVHLAAVHLAADRCAAPRDSEPHASPRESLQ